MQRVLRVFFISLSKARWAQGLITHLWIARRMALRFVAGERLEDAIEVIRQLNRQGINATLDHLGENTSSAEEARQAAEEVVLALRAINQAGVRSNVSIKLSQIGLTVDQELCRANLKRVLEEARSLGSFIRIDMEDSTLTDTTLEMFTWARAQGYQNTGIVIQAYLYRSEADIETILKDGGRVRLCKGAYNEPAKVAFPEKQAVDANYDKLATCLMEGALRAGAPEASADGHIPPIPALATHDEKRIQYALAEVQRLNYPRHALEFQMLYGIRRELQEKLASDGYPVRVYVPYGTHWYPYFMRRLAERPANIWFFLSNLVRR